MSIISLQCRLSRVRAETQGIFVDREEQLSALHLALDSVMQTGIGRTMFVTGEPGIGKTSLIEQFVQSLDGKESLVLQAAGRLYLAGEYVTLMELLEPLFKPKPLVKYGKQVMQTAFNLGKLIPSLGQLAGGLSDAFEGLSGLSQTDSRILSKSFYVNDMVLTLFEKLSKKNIVVALVDDAQWADSSSLEALGYVIEKIARCKMFLVLSLREGYPCVQRETENQETLRNITYVAADGVEFIRLGPFPHDATVEIVRRLLIGRPLGNSEMAMLTKRTNGNPFLINSIVKDFIRTEGHLPSIDKDQSIPTLEGGIPTSITDSISRYLLHIQREDADARRVLDVAAVLGREFSVLDLAGVMEADALKLKHSLESLEETHGIVKATDSPARYEFDHEVTREVVVARLGTIAAGVHLKAAQFIEKLDSDFLRTAEAAAHYESAAEYRDAYRLFLLASSKSLERSGYADSVSYLEKCLTMADSGLVRLGRRDRWQLLLRLSDTTFRDGKFEQARKTARLVNESRGVTTAASAEANLIVGECCRYIGTKEAGIEGLRSLQQSVDAFEALGKQQELGKALSSLSTVLDHFGRHREAIACFGRSQKAFNLARDETGLAVLERKSGMIYDSRRSIQFIEAAMRTFRRTGATIEMARCLNNIGMEFFYLGDFASAKKSLLDALETYRRIDAYEVDSTLNNLGVVYTQTGEVGKAHDMLVEAEKRSSEDFNRICSSSNLAILERLAGKPEVAVLMLKNLVPLVEKSGESLIQDYFAFNMATTLSCVGRQNEALEWLEKFKPNEWKGDVELVKAKRLRAKSVILQRLGHDSDADEARREAETIFRTKRPQKWFYELDHYPCDIHVLD